MNLSKLHIYFNFELCVIFLSIRKTTWDRLQVFSGGVLTELIDRLSKHDALFPLITDKHKRGVERRLLVVYAVVEYCMDREGDKMFKQL